MGGFECNRDAWIEHDASNMMHRWRVDVDYVLAKGEAALRAPRAAAERGG